MKKLIKILLGAIMAASVIACGSFVWSTRFSGNQPEVKQTPISTSDDHTDDEPVMDDSLPTEETIKKTYVRITESTYLNEKKSYQSNHLALLDVNAECLLLEESDGYYKISCDNGKTGWIFADKCESFEKEVVIRHIPKNPSAIPYSMSDTQEGDDLCEILRHHGTVGASVAVIKNGNVTYHYEYGYANKEDKDNPVMINENTKYRIASISKVFTSMLAMAEVEDGMLDLDAKLSDLFGYGFFNPKYPNTPVTMRMLLTHTAGLSSKEGLYNEPLYFVARGQNYYTSKPGNSFSYSNLGMGIAGAVVEKAADKSLSQYARERFLIPMGIDASYDGSLLSDPSLVADCYASGSLRRTKEVMTKPVGRKNTKPGDVFYLGQGNLLISAIDLAKVSTILLNDGMYEGKQYLRSETVRQMLTVHPVRTRTNYEQCIGIRKYTDLIDDRDMYYHTGTFYGILAVMVIDPDDKSGVIVITSGAHPARDDNTIFTVCNDVLNYCYKEII